MRNATTVACRLNNITIDRISVCSEPRETTQLHEHVKEPQLRSLD